MPKASSRDARTTDDAPTSTNDARTTDRRSWQGPRDRELVRLGHGRRRGRRARYRRMTQY